MEKKLLALNCLLFAIIGIFSYAYVDLNLTLTQNKLALEILNFLQQLGYFHRQLATSIFILLFTIAFSFYALILFLIKKEKIGKKFVFVTITFSTLILIFAYPFLSYDIFNYMFDAKIIAHYHLSPYTHNALDFPDDTWTRFMRWTHRYSPYGPIWLGYSLIPTILGFGKFTITLFLFKIFIGTFHLINAFLIYKILNKIKPEMSLFGTTVYALNPLLLSEGVANAHNDVVLAAFLLLSVFFLTEDNKFTSILSSIIGILIKYIPVLILPWTFLKLYKPQNMTFYRLIFANLITMAAFTYVFSSFRITVPFVSSGATQVQFQPWYLFWTLPFAALITEYWTVVLTIAVSAGAITRYLPYLYYGDWSHYGTIYFMQTAIVLPFIICLIFFLFTTKVKIRR